MGANVDSDKDFVLVYNLVYSHICEGTFMQLQPIGSYETKTHLADLLRRVRLGQGFTITQRGEPVADLVPAGTSERRLGAQAAKRMHTFMREAKVNSSINPSIDVKALIESGRD